MVTVGVIRLTVDPHIDGKDGDADSIEDADVVVTDEVDQQQVLQRTAIEIVGRLLLNVTKRLTYLRSMENLSYYGRYSLMRISVYVLVYMRQTEASRMLQMKP